jgi:transcriptional regulator with XRE-family HTH domain
MTENTVAEHRKRLGLSQSQLARLVGVAEPTMWQVEHGKREPWPAIRKRLATTLGVSERELFPESAETTSAGK